METLTKAQRDMIAIRRLLEVKRQVQREAVENYQNNPEIRAIYDHLKKKNSKQGAESK